MIKQLCIFLFLIPIDGHSQIAEGNTKIQSFNESKKYLADVYAGFETDFYCNCKYSKNTIDPVGCGYVPKKANKRSRSIEWEHVVPAHAFGKSFPEWRDGGSLCETRKGKKYKGRDCAMKNPDFRLMEADLYNLQPSIGELNQDRSNFSMAIIEGESREYGACDFEIADRNIEPRPEIRGDIARTYFYMDWAYPGRGVLSDKARRLMEVWDKEDPVDTGERERARRIEGIQKNPNPFIK